MEVTNIRNNKKSVEIWDVSLLRGLVNGQERFIDFDLVRIPLLPFDDKFIIDDVYIHRFSPNDDKVTFWDGNFSFELGIVTKTRIKVEFNDDGSLQDMSGSITDSVSPDNVTVFRLSKDPKDLNIVEPNKFVQKLYGYERRSKKK